MVFGEYKDEPLITPNISSVGMLMSKISQDPEDGHVGKWWLIYILVQIIFSYLVVGINIIIIELFLSGTF